MGDIQKQIDEPETNPIDCDDDFNDYDPDNSECWFCGGDGYVDGSEIASYYDYGWIDTNKVYTCICCGGSGKASDCTFW